MVEEGAALFFSTLAATIHAMKRFRLSLAAAALSIALPGAAASNTNLFIRVNQLGYRPGDTKIAMAFSTIPIGPAFALYPAGPASSNAKATFGGKVTVIADVTWGKWRQHAELDFSKFTKPGRYVLRVGEASSPAFAIDDKVYEPLPDQLLEFMREQQCGYNPWLGKPCHTNDARTAYGPLPFGTELDCTGGWHDAADLLKYLITSPTAPAQAIHQLPPPPPPPPHRTGSHPAPTKPPPRPPAQSTTRAAAAQPTAIC